LSDSRVEQNDITLKPGPRKGTFVKDSAYARETGEVGESDDGAVFGVLEEEG